MEKKKKKKWDYNRRERARGILTPNERIFLEKMKSRHGLLSNGRNYLSSIIHKTRKGIADLDLIFQKLEYPDIAFVFSEKISVKEPIEKLVKFYYRSEKDKLEAKRQLEEIMNSALDKLQ